MKKRLYLDLRIGNIIKSKNTNEIYTCQIIHIIEDMRGYDYILPVELTTDFIIEFGFKLCEDISWYLPFSPDWNIGKNKFGFFVYHDQLDQRLMSIKIEYVHELQNLYYFLTGNELQTQAGGV